MSEIIIKTNVRAYSKDCIGCKRHKAHTMISFSNPTPENKHAITDLFLNKEQAESFYEELGRVLERSA